MCQMNTHASGHSVSSQKQKKMFIFLLLNYAYSQVVNCPEGWIKDRSHCYRVFTDKLNWNAAESKCQTFGGDLVSIEDKEKQDKLLFMLDRDHYDYFWIGLTDHEQMGVYKWTKTDGTECDYKFKWWAKGMPNDNDGARCTYMLFSDHLPGKVFSILLDRRFLVL